MRTGRAVMAVVTAATVAGTLGGTAVASGRHEAPQGMAVTPAPAVLPMLPVDPTAASPLTPRQRSLLVRDLQDAALGTGVSALVADAESPQLARTPAASRTPASTLKLLTATAALQLLDATDRLTTSAVLAQPEAGSRTAEVVVVGGGDATLQTTDDPVAPGSAAFWRPATLTELARRTASALTAREVTSVRVGYDARLFTGPSVAPSWEPDYVSSGVVAPVTALMVDEGLADPASGSLVREADPARAAADAFARLLRGRGLRVVGPTSSVGPAFDAQAATALASVASPPVSWLVERMLTDSDNQLAEALARLVAAADGRPASFRGAGATLRATAVAAAGRPAARVVRVLDGSGLSRADRLSAAVLVSVLRQAVDDPGLRPVLTALPVAAFTGTLEDRYRSGVARAGAGVVRAKTGTLTGVDTEAGLVVDGSGALRVFAFMADTTTGDVEQSRDALDRAASRLVP